MSEPAEDLNRASLHVRITCPHCRRSNLRIKRANLGCEVVCKHCGNRFLAVLADEPGALATSTPLGPGEPHPSAPDEADQRHGANGEGELQRIRAERDRLRAKLREREADRLRLTQQAAELEALRTDRDRLEAAVWDGVAREENLQARIQEAEWRSGEVLDQAEDEVRVWKDRLDNALLQLERDLPHLREEAEGLRNQVKILVEERDAGLRQVEALGSDRDRLAVALERAEAAGREAARHQADAHRLARTIEQDRDQLAATVRRNEELAQQARELGTKLDSLHRDQEHERREQRTSLEALRHELENARAEATDRAAAAAAVRGELEGRLAEFEDRLRAANEQSQRLESEMHAQHDWVAALSPESEPGRSPADGDREADRFRHQVEALVRERDVALRQVEALGSDRDRLAVALERAEAAGREAARHEADAHRLARTIEQDRVQLAATARRNEELAEQARELDAKLDSLHRDQEDERREQRTSLEALRHELENARAQATAATDRAAAAAAVRGELEGRLAEFEDRLRAAHEQSQRLESEMQAQRDWVAALSPESEPGRSPADGDREADRFRHQVEALVRERDVALRQVEALGSDRDRLAVALERAEAAGREAARHEADAHRLARTIEQDRVQLATTVRRNEELAEQTRELGTKLDSLQRDQEDERREQRTSLEAVRRELENARAQATAATDRAAAAAAVRGELEGRLAEFEDRLRAAHEQSQRLESEMQAQRDWVAALSPTSEPGRSPADGDREADRLRIELLTADLDQARAANERLRSLLNVFGLVDHLGSGAGLPPSV